MADRQIQIMKTNDWKPIESAPKDGTTILGFMHKDWISSMSWDSDAKMWEDSYEPWRYFPDPTHWMPLPEPPQL